MTAWGRRSTVDPSPGLTGPDLVPRRVAKATKKVSKAIDKGDHDDVVKALNEGGEKIVEAIDKG